MKKLLIILPLLFMVGCTTHDGVESSAMFGGSNVYEFTPSTRPDMDCILVIRSGISCFKKES